MKKKIVKEILIILILALIFTAEILPRELVNLDEIWIYNFARNIANGLLPYKDFNIVTTPLLAIICGVILKLTVNELIIMRFLAIILSTLIFYITYKILEVLKVNKTVITISILIIYKLLYKYLCIDYNFAVLLIVLITIYYELKKLEKGNKILNENYKTDFLVGILVGTSILFKQTTGMAVSLVYVFYKVLIVSNKEDAKIIGKTILYRFLGVIIPIAIFVIYLIFSRTLYECLDYTIYALNTFKNKIPYILLLKGNYGIIIAILSIALPVMIIVMYFVSVYKNIETEEQKNILIMFAYSVATFIVVYPISDSIHFLIGSFPSIISTIYILWLLVEKLLKIFKKKKLIYRIKYFIESVIFLFILLIIINSSKILMQYIITCNQYVKLEHFKYIPSESITIEKVDEFIKQKDKENKKVYILDATAALYMIPIDKYNKNYDLFLIGNLGEKGEEGQIENLKNCDENTILLIMNDNYSRNWQNPEQVRKYIINNWTKTGEIEFFDIYMK